MKLSPILFAFLIVLNSCNAQDSNFDNLVISSNIDTTILNKLTEREIEVIEREKSKVDTSKNKYLYSENRSKIKFKSGLKNEKAQDEPHINSKITSCECYLDNDSLFIQFNNQNSSYFGPTQGSGVDIKIVKNKFNSHFFIWHRLYKIYKLSSQDEPLPYVIVQNSIQYLTLSKSPFEKRNDVIYGKLIFKTDDYYISNDSVKEEKVKKTVGEYYQGEITFKCRPMNEREEIFTRYNKKFRVRYPIHKFNNDGITEIKGDTIKKVDDKNLKQKRKQYKSQSSPNPPPNPPPIRR